MHIRKTVISSMVDYLWAQILEISKASQSKSSSKNHSIKPIKRQDDSDDDDSSDLDMDYLKKKPASKKQGSNQGSESISQLKLLGPFFT